MVKYQNSRHYIQWKIKMLLIIGIPLIGQLKNRKLLSIIILVDLEIPRSWIPRRTVTWINQIRACKIQVLIRVKATKPIIIDLDIEVNILIRVLIRKNFRILIKQGYRFWVMIQVFGNNLYNKNYQTQSNVKIHFIIMQYLLSVPLELQQWFQDLNSFQTRVLQKLIPLFQLQVHFIVETALSNRNIQCQAPQNLHNNS